MAKNAAELPCTYCGSIGPTTADHVPPACIFPEPRPSTLRTVPACEECNKRFGLDDEYFRDAIAIVAFEKPSARPIAEKFMRSVQRPKRQKYKADFFASMRELDLHSQGGLYLGTSTVCDVDGARLLRVIERVVRGLYFANENVAMPLEQPVYVYESSSISLQRPDLVPVFQKIATAIIESPGTAQNFGEVFSYKFGFVDREQLPFSTWWILRFHNQMLFFARAGELTDLLLENPEPDQVK